MTLHKPSQEAILSAVTTDSTTQTAKLAHAAGAREATRATLDALLRHCVTALFSEAPSLAQRIRADLQLAADLSGDPTDQAELHEIISIIDHRQGPLVGLLQQRMPLVLQRAADTRTAEIPAATLHNAPERAALIAHTVQLLEELSGETLPELTRQMSWLRGSSVPLAELNPFRPEVLVSALLAAWEEFDGRWSSTRALLRALQAQNFLPLGTLYPALIQTLGERLESLRRTQPASLLGLQTQPGHDAGAQGTRELVARIFEDLLSSAAIPIGIKAVIAPLQLPMLQAAMRNSEFFLGERHPSCLLLERLASAALLWNPGAGSNDALYRAIESVAHRAEASFGEAPEVFERFCTEVDGVIRYQEQRIQAAIQDLAVRLAREEAETHARAEVDRRIARRFELAPISPALGQFLNEQWRQLLVERCITRDVDPDAWTQSLEAMDVLIWSVLPKVNGHERRELVRTLPGLITHIEHGLDCIGWTGDARTTFMHQLMDTHAGMMRGVLSEHPGSLISGSSSSPRTMLIDDPNTRPRPRPRLPFERGEWFMLQGEAESGTRLRLSWISPLCTRYVLTQRGDAPALILTDHEVHDLTETGRLRKLDTRPVVQRIIDETLGSAPDLSDADPALAAR